MWGGRYLQGFVDDEFEVGVAQRRVLDHVGEHRVFDHTERVGSFQGVHCTRRRFDNSVW